MKITLIDKYIARHVISASLLILFLLIMLRAMFSLLEESNDIGIGQYQLADALLYVGLMLPQKIIELFPMGVLIGSLFGLGVLAANNELTVMRSAGVTTWGIALSTLKASLLSMVFVFLMSEVVAPATSKAAQQLRTAAMSDGKISRSASGLWAKRDNQFIHIATIRKNGEMHNISLFQLDDNYHFTKLIEANSAQIIDGSWFLIEGVETSFAEEKIDKSHFQMRLWENPLEEDSIDTLTLKPETMNIRALMKYQEYLDGNALDSSEIELTIWQKAFLPISVAIMMFLAASFVFGPMRNVTMGARVLAGVMLGFGFHLAKQSFGPISLIYGVSPFVGAIIPLFAFAGVAVWLMYRAN